ncbi:MAG: DinB family protein, partial [Chloroflexota bacterium]
SDFTEDMHQEITDLAPDVLAWQPDPEANSIGVTLWHVSRWLDLITVRAIQNRPPEEEQWHTQGWTEKTGYDPRGVGLNGFGAITGYSLAEVKAVPKLTAPDLLGYLDQVSGALQDQLRTISTGTLHQPSPGLDGSRTIYNWVKPILKGCFRHAGEIQALKALQSRI